jgi:hypothetical protein
LPQHCRRLLLRCAMALRQCSSAAASVAVEAFDSMESSH